MEISPRELRDVEIRESLRGYNRDEVNDLLERAAATIEATTERLQQLTERLASAQTEAGRTRETEDVLHRTLLLAQRAADEAVAEATAKARQMLDDADIQSRRLVAEGESDARRKGESERRRLEEEILDLAGRRDSLLADVEALTRFEAEYRERMVRALEADLFALRSRPTTAPGTRPETSEVEIPDDDETGSRQETSAPASASAPNAPQSAPTSAPPAAPPAAQPPTLRPATPAPVPAAAQDKGPTAPPAPAQPPRGGGANMGTHEVDVRTLFEQSKQAAAAAPNAAMPQQQSPPAPPANDAPRPPQQSAPGPIDLLGNDGGDADVLDDDAFFATLRDAVHDDAPLGPRDDDDPSGDHRFFDQDADRGSFRDVFRRRR
jgi:DivIVA domain-containing protein